MKTHYCSILFLFVLLLSGCSSKKTAAPVTVSPVGAAKVIGIEILRLATEPVQVRVLIRGELPDGCTTIQKIVGGKSGDDFQYSLTLARPPDAACSPGAVPFERLVPLDVQGLPAGRYTVTVEGVQEAFDLTPPVSPATQVAASLQATPAPVQTAAPAATEAAPPEATTPEASQTSEASTGGEAQVPQTATAMEEPAPTQESAGPSEPAAPPSESPPAVPVEQPAGCADRAAFYGDVSIPDDTVLRQGEVFTKTWRVRNEGSCAWGEGYSLVFAGGDMMNGPLSSTLPQVQPGENDDVSVVLTAPSGGGAHTGKWQFQNAAGQRFGVGTSGQDTIWVQVRVSFVTSDSTPGTGEVTGCDAQGNPDIEAKVLQLMNAARVENGLDPLALQDSLTAAAREHSLDMACQNFTDHTGSDGSRPKDRVARQGYSYSRVLENIYYGFLSYQGDADGAFAWWKDSATHWNNILDPDVTEVGIGYAYTTHSTYDSYYTVNFAAPGE